MAFTVAFSGSGTFAGTSVPLVIASNQTTDGVYQVMAKIASMGIDQTVNIRVEDQIRSGVVGIIEDYRFGPTSEWILTPPMILTVNWGVTLMPNGGSVARSYEYKILRVD